MGNDWSLGPALYFERIRGPPQCLQGGHGLLKLTPEDTDFEMGNAIECNNVAYNDAVYNEQIIDLGKG